jgi:hypothetical protein
LDKSQQHINYTISGLNSGNLYSVKITMNDRYYKWWHGYTNQDSIEGGLGLETNTPVAPFNNWKSFNFTIV